jgi:3-methyl-2-oxobutanoate hydroxymethyltransferase
VVLEKIPASLAKQVSESLTIPTIGIGAGKHCDGQVLVMHELVMHDMLGINTEFKPRFLRQYLNLHELATKAVEQYINDVRKKDFPKDTESY